MLWGIILCAFLLGSVVGFVGGVFYVVWSDDTLDQEFRALLYDELDKTHPGL